MKMKTMIGGLLAVGAALGLALSAEAYIVWTDNTVHTGSWGAGTQLVNEEGANRYRYQPTSTGWYRFYSSDHATLNRGDPFVMVATGTAADSYIQTNGRLYSTPASTMSDMIVYDDDGGNVNGHFSALAYLYAGTTYYVYCSRYSATGSTSGYNINFVSYSSNLPDFGTGTLSNGGSARRRRVPCWSSTNCRISSRNRPSCRASCRRSQTGFASRARS